MTTTTRKPLLIGFAELLTVEDAHNALMSVASRDDASAYSDHPDYVGAQRLFDRRLKSVTGLTPRDPFYAQVRGDLQDCHGEYHGYLARILVAASYDVVVVLPSVDTYSLRAHEEAERTLRRDAAGLYRYPGGPGSLRLVRDVMVAK